MAIRPDYDIGTVTLVASSANFTTTGASLQTAAVQAGDAIITPSGNVLIIASVTGQNTGTLFLPCPTGAAGTDLPLRIRFQPDGSRYQGAVRNIIDLLSSGNIEAFAALVGAAGMVPIFTGVGTMDLADPATFGIQDPNGSLGKLAALTLAARQILQTDAAGDLKQIALAANKFLRTDANADIQLSDITAAATALLNLSGTAAADQLPYFTGANGAGLTPITPFARSILDDTTGSAVWTTLGGSESNSIIKFPNGIMLQQGWHTLPSVGYGTIPFPTAFPTACYGVAASILENAGANYTYMITAGSVTQASFYGTGHIIQPSSITLAGVTFNWIAWGN